MEMVGALNGKPILARAGLAEMDALARISALDDACHAARQVLDIPPPDGLRLDSPGR